jgi:hypothetical protein
MRGMKIPNDTSLCEKNWDSLDITYEYKQMEQFIRALRKRYLTYFMNFTKNPKTMKAKIKNNFLSFFKTQDIKHLAAKKLKEIKKRPFIYVREYEKRF